MHSKTDATCLYTQSLISANISVLPLVAQCSGHTLRHIKEKMA